ncbi:MAG TPA: 3,4-dihydroxy-2-butanone-4-phosphate synthase [Buchnera sp. (in: enterobacteria)]|nr:3,4-dihydroxy-2-butanone-4-phosphate synthase [Buchnera sp. (in: enterobacteria)]
MNQKSSLSLFGKNSQERVKNAIISLNKGQGIILIDDVNRENEGDLIFSCTSLTVEQIALTIRYGSGIICLCITEARRQQLELPMMVKNNTSTFQTNFTVSIEAAQGVSTGVSAQDRLTTIYTATSDHAKPSDLNRPGHIFPLLSHQEGLSVRRGHTEATIQLMHLAKLKPTGILCELTNDDGSMSRTPEIIRFAQLKKITVITMEDLINYIK